MSPIAGVAWADLIGAAVVFPFALMLLGFQVLLADAVPLAGRAGRALKGLVVGLVVPFLVIVLNDNWLAPPDAIRVASLVGWLIGTPLVMVRADRIRRGSTPDQPQPLPPDRYDPAAGPDARPRRRFPRLAAIALLAAAIVAPRTAAAILTQTPCEVVEILLAERPVEAVEAEPARWMPHSEFPGYVFADGGPTTLEDVVRTRKNPDESRVELERDGFLRGFQQRWEGPIDDLEFGAQRFETTDGALAFQAFANRYACQFANEAFRGPRGSLGLQIRYGSGRPIGEQLTWVSNTTRVLVFVGFDAAPADHTRVEAVAGMVGS